MDDVGTRFPPPVPPFEPGPRTAKRGNPILGVAIVFALAAFVAGLVVTILVFSGMH
jgi:hypothetical protein